MKLQYLGTAAAEGIPALFCTCEACRKAREKRGREVRTRAGAMLDGCLKLDFGPDSYKQMLDNHLDYTHLKSVLITHAHEDHLCVGDLACRRRGFAVMPKDAPPVTIYGNERVHALMSKYLGEDLAFCRLKPFETTVIEGYRVTPLEAAHCADFRSDTFPVECKGRVVPRSEEALIYLIERDGKRLLYAHDTDLLTPSNMAFLVDKRLDLVSLDCTNGVLDADYIGHMGIRENLMTRDRLLDCGAADGHTVFVANHFSHNGYVTMEEMQRRLPGFVISYDGLTIEF